MARVTALHAATHIDSAKNPRIKTLLRLEARRVRDREGRALVEGVREVSRAFEAGVPLETLLVAPEFLSDEGEAVVHTVRNHVSEMVTLARAPFERLSHRQNPDGLLAVITPNTPRLDDVVLPASPLLLVAIATEKPGNLGALLRTADAVGVDAVLLAEGDDDALGTDPWNPNVIRASMGSVFHLPVITVGGASLQKWLAERGVHVVVTDPTAATTLWDATLTGPLALVLGAEHAGVPDAWRDVAHQRIAIPMHGAADSLNVSVSGALVLYEALRQRRVAP